MVDHLFLVISKMWQILNTNGKTTMNKEILVKSLVS